MGNRLNFVRELTQHFGKSYTAFDSLVLVRSLIRSMLCRCPLRSVSAPLPPIRTARVTGAYRHSPRALAAVVY